MRGSRWTAPMSDPASPTLTNRKAILARSDSNRKSLARARAAPAPAAMPFTAAMTGFSSRRMLRTTSQVSRVKRYSPAPSIFKSSPMMSLTLPPEQKPLPAPVRISTSTRRSAARDPVNSANSS